MGWVHDSGEQMFVRAASMRMPVDILTRLQPLIGLVGILALAYALSTNRRAISLRVVGWGLGLAGPVRPDRRQDRARHPRRSRGSATRSSGCWRYSVEGSRFVFGPLGDVAIWSKVMNGALGAEGGQYAVIFAFQILPTIIFIAALFAILYYIGVMQLIVRAVRGGDEQGDGRERRRVAERRRQHLHGPDRGAADDPPVPAAHDAVGADDGDDLRHGAHLRRHHGRLHRVRHRGRSTC